MNEVSCTVLAVFMEPLQQKGVPLQSMVAGTSVSLATLRNRKARIDWPDFVAVLGNLRKHFSDEEYVEIGRSYMRTPGLKFAAV
ncbi:MAG TPA: hypothetical protein VN253_14980, partial [Kofleriaceae bacterium]|nr:hypothetical protein [Kofleriaceae bacterium]